MTDKTQQIFLLEYNQNTQFKEPDNLSNHSEQQTTQKPKKDLNDSQQDEASSLVDQFDQTPIHKYGSRPVCMQTPEKQDEEKGELQRNKMILEFKVTELQKICNTLTSANSKLLDKIEELQQQNDRQKSRIVDLQREVQVHQSRVEHNYYGGERQGDESEQNINDMDDSRENGSMIIVNGSQSVIEQQQDNKEQQQLQQQVSDIQKMIKEYREQLRKAQQVNRSNKLLYGNRIDQLQAHIESIILQMDSISQLNLQLEDQLHQLEETNSKLENKNKDVEQRNKEIEVKCREIQQRSKQVEQRNMGLEQEVKQLRSVQLSIKSNNIYMREDMIKTESQSSYYHTPSPNIKHSASIYNNGSNNYNNPSLNNYNNPSSSSNYNSHYMSNQQEYLSNQSFSSTLQLQLQKLIDKLVKQLQIQRSTKSKMSSQLKRVQSQLLSSQKLIIHKNQQIHQLQMQLLQYEKSNLLNKNTIINKNLLLSNNNSMVYNNPQKSKGMINNKGVINKSDYLGNKQSTTTNQRVTNNNNPSLVNKNYSSPQYNQQDQKQSQQSLQQQQYNKIFNSKNRNINIITNTSSQSVNQQSNTQLSFNKNSLHSTQQSPTSTKNNNKNNNNLKNTNISNSPISNNNNSNGQPQKKLLQTFTLMQLLNNSCITLSTKQKLNIALKLIQFYEHKIYTQQNYQLLSLQHILITNFNKINLRLIKVKTNPSYNQSTSQQEDFADCVQKLIENLAFLLNSLLVDVPNGDDNQFGQTQTQKLIKSKINSALENQNISESTLQELKSLVQSALNESINQSQNR